MKNFNILSRTGVTDLDLANTLKLDSELAGTPKINDAAYQRAFEINVKGLMSQGMPEPKARSEAGKMIKKAKIT